MIMAVVGGSALYQMLFVEGIRTTLTGSIQLHKMSYDPVLRMEYTDCEMRTYSGDTHHIQLIGHVELTYGKTYRITYVKENYWAHLIIVNRAINITEMGDVPA